MDKAANNRKKIARKRKSFNRIEPVTHANIDWRDGAAFSESFDDIYFSEESGLEESRYVFLQQNNIPAAWEGKAEFTILETGFGTGLNFFCVLEQWFQTADDHAVLNFISVEKYPLTLADFKLLATKWPAFADYIDELVKHYPPTITGFHWIKLFSGRVRCLLIYGDATSQLESLNCQADVCFLDGFAPSKNASMWSPQLFSQLARLLKTGATLSTFTAVGDVRRGLQDVGFTMKKVDAFGNKRHMLIGTLTEQQTKQNVKPWFAYSTDVVNRQKVLVIGAGIAGLTTAFSLNAAGFDVTVVEQASDVAAGASGNPAGIVQPRLDQKQSLDANFYWQAFYYAVDFLSNLGVSEDIWKQTGVLQKVDKQSQLDWPQSLYECLSAEQASELAGIKLDNHVLHIAVAGKVAARQLCDYLYQRLKTEVVFKFNARVDSLTQTPAGWSVTAGDQVLEADAVVICSAHETSRFEQTRHFDLQAIRGQISVSENEHLSRKLKVAVCDKGYLVPHDDKVVLGATFDRNKTNTDVNETDHAENLLLVNQVLNEKDALSLDSINAGRASVRAMARDRMPVVGPVPDVEFYAKHYADLHKGRSPSCYPNGRYLPGLYVNTAHGSRGFTSSFLSAELVASLFSGAVLPVPGEILERLHPGRLQIKQYIKP